jgi:hypothetical protein
MPNRIKDILMNAIPSDQGDFRKYPVNGSQNRMTIRDAVKTAEMI